MKNYDETISAVFERIDEFEKIKVRKRKLAVKTLIPLTCLCLATIIGISVWQNQNAKPSNTSDSSKTSSQNKKVIYVTGDTQDDYAVKNSSSLYLNKKYISPMLQEKIDLYKDYKDVEVVYKVIVKIFTAFEDENEANRLADADKEVQSLYEEQVAAYLEEQKAWAEYRAFGEANPNNDPETIEKNKEFVAIIKEKEEKHDILWNKWSNLRSEIEEKYFKQVRAERLKFATQFSEKDPVATSYNEWAFYMDLTAEEINILAEKGGYTFKFASGDFYAADKNN